MRQACNRFVEFLDRRFGQSSTPKHYRSDLNIFMQTVGEKRPEEITAQDVDAFVERQIREGLAPATINRRLSTLRSFFEYLAAEQPAQAWPNLVSHRRHRLKLGAHLPRDVMEPDVARPFAVISDERDKAMFSLMVGAGLRVGEVAAVRLDALTAPAGPEQLAKLRILGKGHMERIVWLTTPLWVVVSAGLQVRPPVTDDHLFLNHHGRPLSVAGIQYRLKQYCQAAGVTFTCHCLRHTFARRLVEQGLAVESLAKLLGHTHLQTTQRYIDGADPTLRADFVAAMTQLATAPVAPQVTPLALPHRLQAEQRQLSEQDRLRRAAGVGGTRAHLVPLLIREIEEFQLGGDKRRSIEAAMLWPCLAATLNSLYTLLYNKPLP